MNSFERIYQIDSSRENKVEIEKSNNIELSDEMICAHCTYAISQVINELPPIPMKLEMPLLEEEIVSGKKKIKSKKHKKS